MGELKRNVYTCGTTEGLGQTLKFIREKLQKPCSPPPIVPFVFSGGA